MKKDVKLYNLILPTYVILYFSPGTAVITMLGNFIIDSIVLLIASKLIYKEIAGKFYIKTIWKVWLSGYASDIIGVIYLLLISTSIRNASSDIWSFLTKFSAVILAGFFIFVFNYYISFSKAEMTKSQKFKTSLAYAVFTAPYTILFF